MLDDFLLRIEEILCDLFVTELHVENLHVVDVHAVLFERRTTSAELASAWIDSLSKHCITHKVFGRRVELLDTDFLGGRPKLGPKMISQELRVVLDREPFL